VGIYTECMLTYGWRLRDTIGTQRFLEPRTTWRERAFISNTLEPFDDFGKGDILDCRGATYGIGRSSHPAIMTVGAIGGLYKANNEDLEGENGSQNSKFCPVLFKKKGSLKQICANIDIRNADKKGFLPRQRWKGIIDRIIIGALPDSAVNSLKGKIEKPEQLWRPIKIKDRQKAYENAVKNNLKWFRDTGLLPAADGSEGVYEGFDTYGHIMSEYRPECQLEPALMFHLAGEYFNDPELIKIADNIVTFALNSGMQITDKKAKDYGLWYFYKQFSEDADLIYVGGASKTSSCLLHFYRLTGREDGLHSAKITLDAILKLRNSNGVLPDCVSRSNVEKCGMHGVTEEIKELKDRKYGTPHFHSSVVSALVNLHLTTGNKEYLNAAAHIQRCLISGFPDKFEDHFVASFTIGRYIMGLSSLMNTSLKSEFISPLKCALEYALKLQHSKGAFVSEVHGSLAANTFETGIACSNDDEIADNLYVNNHLAVGLQMAGWAPEVGLDDSVIEKLLDFQANSQPLCALHGRTGAWTRAFNLKTGDPFAFNGDVGWGPYCTMTGWSNAMIVISFLMRLGNNKIIL